MTKQATYEATQQAAAACVAEIKKQGLYIDANPLAFSMMVADVLTFALIGALSSSHADSERALQVHSRHVRAMFKAYWDEEEKP
jgi:hypothetical protein